jgi:hypothetical protein
VKDKVKLLERKQYDYSRFQSFIRRRFTDSELDHVLDMLSGVADCLGGAIDTMT